MRTEFAEYRVQDLIAQGRLAIGDGYRAKNDELAPAGLPFARAGNVNDGFHFDDSDYFPEADLSRVGDKISQPGDAVFTSKGTVGRFAYVRSDTPRFVYSPQLCYWRALDTELIDPRYLFYWMCGPDFLGQYKGVAAQTDMADYVSLGDQRSMRLTLPPIARQREIARILGALDDKIELNRRMSQTLESMARALFKSWFVDFAATGARSGTLQDSEVGPIPEGWAAGRISDLLTLERGLSYSGAGLSDTGPPMVTLGCFGPSGEFQESGLKRYRGEYRPRHTVQRGDLLLANTDITQKREVLGSPALLPPWLGESACLFTHHVFAARLLSRWSDEWRSYLYYTLLEEGFRERARGFATGTTVLSLPADAVLGYTVPMPPASIVKAFDKAVAPLRERRWEALSECRALEVVRDRLVPGLVSGRLE